MVTPMLEETHLISSKGDIWKCNHFTFKYKWLIPVNAFFPNMFLLFVNEHIINPLSEALEVN